MGILIGLEFTLCTALIPQDMGNYCTFDSITCDTGGRTVQALPKGTQVTGQMRRQKNYNYTKRMVIIYLPYTG